jgi:predicted double-glycine peptidase
MVLDYWGILKSEKELAELLNTEKNLGISDNDLKRVAEALGLKVEIMNFASLEDIFSWLDKKVPVIVNWFTRGRSDYSDSEVSDGYYSVVVGLDSEYIYLQDPEIGTLRKIGREDFLKVWFDFRGEKITSWDEMIVRQLIAIYPDRDAY